MCVIHKMNLYVCLGCGIEYMEQNEHICVLFTKWIYMCVWVRVWNKMNIYVCYSQNEYMCAFELGYRVYGTKWIYMCIIHKMNIYVCLG